MRAKGEGNKTDKEKVFVQAGAAGEAGAGRSAKEDGREIRDKDTPGHSRVSNVSNVCQRHK